MLPKYHAFLGLIFSFILFLIFPQINSIAFLIIFFSSFLIDIDHYFSYVFRKKEFSIKKAYYFFLKKRKRTLSKKLRNGIPNPRNYLLHGIEIIFLLLFLGMIFSKYFLFISIGFGFHLILDVLEEKYHKLKIAKISLIYDFINFKQKSV